MASSGIKTSPEVVETVKGFKMNKIENEYLVVKVSDDGKLLVIDEEFHPDKKPREYDDDSEKGRFHKLREELRGKNKPRYVFYEFRTKTPEGRTIEKIAMIHWNLDSYPIKEKMVYSATRNTLATAVQIGSGLSIEIHGDDDWPYDEVLAQLKKS